MASVLGIALLAASPVGAKDKRIQVTPPQNVVTDPSLAAFRATLGEIAKARDLKQIKPLVGPSFFWDRDFGGGYDAHATPVANLTAALDLDDAKLSPEYKGTGWRRLATIVASPMFTPGEHAKTVCGPTPPTYKEGAIEDELIWGYVLDRVDVLASPASNAPSVGTLENEAVEVLEPASDELGHADFAKVKLPNGKAAYVEAGALHGFLEEQLCFQKLKGTWRIVGYGGGGD